MRVLAYHLLKIEDDERLAEMEEIAGLLALISEGISRLQQTRPEEPPPATLFVPATLARDFWEGTPNGA